MNTKLMKEFIIKRLRNKAFWVGLLAFVAMIGKQSGAYEVPLYINNYVDIALQILVFIGVVIDPSTKGFGDAKVIMKEVVELVDPKNIQRDSAIIDALEPVIEKQLSPELDKIRQALK